MKTTLFRRMLAASLCAVTVLSLFSCGQTEPETPTTESETEAVTLPPAVIENVTFPKNEMERFKIVYADGSDEAVKESAQKLAVIIKSVCGYEPIVTNDFLMEGSSTFCEYEYEILLGETNRKESQDFIPTLRQDDQGYTCIGKKILVGARDDRSLMEAIDDFTVTVVMGKKSDEMFFRPEWARVNQGRYETETLTVNGKPIQSFRIVYPIRGSAFEEALATKLQLAIADQTGYILPIVADTKPDDGTPELRIGANARKANEGNTEDGKGYLKGNGESVCLFGSTAKGNSLAVEAFVEAMAEKTENKVCSLTYGERETVDWDRSTVRSMSFNVLTTDLSTSRRDRVVSTILRSLPDTFGVQEANPNWMAELQGRLGQYYSYVGTGTGGGSNGEHVAVFYSKERFELVESNTYWLTETPEENSKMPGTEWPRVYTYAVLKDKVTGESFMHLNTHLDTAGSDIRLAEVLLLMEFLEDYNDLPVILTGDLNAKAESVEMQTLFNNQFIQPMDALEDAKNQKPSFYIGDCTIDYVLITNDCLEMLNYRVEGERIYGDYASDHNAVYIDFKFRDMEGEIDHGWKEIQTGYPDEWLDVEEELEADDSFGGIHLIP